MANTSQGDTTLAARDSTVRLVAVHQRDGRHCVSAAPAGRACDPEARGEADTGRIRCAGRGISYTGTALLSSSRFPNRTLTSAAMRAVDLRRSDTPRERPLRGEVTLVVLLVDCVAHYHLLMAQPMRVSRIGWAMPGCYGLASFVV